MNIDEGFERLIVCNTRRAIRSPLHWLGTQDLRSVSSLRSTVIVASVFLSIRCRLIRYRPTPRNRDPYLLTRDRYPRVRAAEGTVLLRDIHMRFRSKARHGHHRWSRDGRVPALASQRGFNPPRFQHRICDIALSF